MMVCCDELHEVRKLLTAKLCIDWIPSYLSSEAKAALRAEMEKPPTEKDVRGYIYCYEIINSKDPKQIRLKVGRTAKLAKRFNEWEKQCGEKLVPRGLWPSTFNGANLSLLRGQIQAGKDGKYSHKLEREQSKSTLPNSLKPSCLPCRLDST